MKILPPTRLQKLISQSGPAEVVTPASPAVVIHGDVSSALQGGSGPSSLEVTVIEVFLDKPTEL